VPKYEDGLICAFFYSSLSMFGESSPDKVKAFLFLPDKSDNPRWKERESKREDRQRNEREQKKDFLKLRI
jgi:hypothetical protein